MVREELHLLRGGDVQHMHALAGLAREPDEPLRSQRSAAISSRQTGCERGSPATRSCLRSLSRYSSSEWNEARRLIALRMLRTPSSSSTSSEPVDEPMNTFTPAQPGRRSSSARSRGVLARAADEEREIAVHAVMARARPCRRAPRRWWWSGSVLGISNTAVTPPMHRAPRAGTRGPPCGSGRARGNAPGVSITPGQDMQAAAVDHLARPRPATGRRCAAMRPPAMREIAHALAVVVDDGAALEQEVVALGHSSLPPL